MVDRNRRAIWVAVCFGGSSNKALKWATNYIRLLLVTNLSLIRRILILAARDRAIEDFFEGRVAFVAFRFKLGATTKAAWRLSSGPLGSLIAKEHSS